MLAPARILRILGRRGYSQTTGGTKPPTASAPVSGASGTTGSINPNVPGLSSKCVKPSAGPVGPGAAPNAAYKVPEYFCFDRFSFAEAEVEMSKFRCPQPSALKK